MKINLTENLSGKNSLLVLGLWEDNLNQYQQFSSELTTEIQDAAKSKRYEFHFGESITTKIPTKSYQKILVLGLGKKSELTLERLRKSMGKIIKCARGLKLFSIETNIIELTNTQFSSQELGRTLAEGAILANYEFTKYLAQEKKDKKKLVEEITFTCPAKLKTELQQGVQQGIIIATNTNLAKDLVNEPPSVATPTYIEKIAKTIAKQSSFSLTILEKSELERLGLHSFLGVSRGSSQPPKLLILKYTGAPKQSPPKPYKALIGKGITFDSGGYNLKPTGGIEDMKSDMAGAAAVLATIKTAAELKLEQNILAVMPLCENMIGGCAQKPGDIVKAFNGKTIEIRNTDAEGRLILADALSYTEATYKPEIMIDLATLTGACVIALGYYASGLMSKDDQLISSLTLAGQQSGDRVWSLPFFEEYHDAMDGTISDLRNMSGKGKGYEAGAINGGVFLSKFVDKARWAHIDIAGPAFLLEDNDYSQKGGSGAGVRLLSYWLMNK